jgi:hypothetical protein
MSDDTQRSAAAARTVVLRLPGMDDVVVRRDLVRQALAFLRTQLLQETT